VAWALQALAIRLIRVFRNYMAKRATRTTTTDAR
jgi:hypothetical protein